MKLKKIISIILMLSIILTIPSCNDKQSAGNPDNIGKGDEVSQTPPTESNGDSNTDTEPGTPNTDTEPGTPNTDTEPGTPDIDTEPELTGAYWGTKVLDSIEDLKSAMNLINDNSTYRKCPHYAVMDSIGEEYKVFYLFNFPHANMTYPVSFEDFFSNRMCWSSFSTYIYLVNDEEHICNYEHTGASDEADIAFWINPLDTDSLSMVENYCGRYAIISFATIYDGKEPLVDIASISDRSLITIKQYESSINKGINVYNLYYDSKHILTLSSCLDLSLDDINHILDNLTIV
jgi:hypothetical protein